MKTVSLLLDQEENAYQQMLAKDAARQAARLEFALLHTRFANGSSFVQMEQLLGGAKGDQKVDGIVIMTAGAESQLPASKRVAKAGLSLVFLNRVPAYLEDLQRDFPDVLIAAVAPDQVEIGRIQAAQCQALLPRGGFVLLVMGTAGNPSAVGRQQGLMERVGASTEVHPLDGQWTDESAFKALSDWFRLGAERTREISLVVCQNDQMARGARRALARQAMISGQPALGHIPVTGCDGLPAEGQKLVAEGELAATVVMPLTTTAALDGLAAFWSKRQRMGTVLLRSESFPAVDRIGAR
jgi:ABC-type sugar transport system substrate-binding protein